MRKWRFAALLLACVADRAYAAGGSYLVDDAAVTPEGACQIESWLRREGTALFEIATTPACTRAGIEYSISYDRAAGGGIGLTSFVPGLKWVSGDLQRDRWAGGIAATATITNGLVDNTSLYLPLSIALDPGANFVVHANVGLQQERRGRRDLLSGIGADFAVSQEWHALAEFMRIGTQARVWQGGLRWVFTDALNLDLIAGRRFSSSREHWLTVGLNVAL